MSKIVLIVDDDSLVRRSLSDALTAKGITVEEALNGKQGLEKALGKPVNLVVTDIRMPEMDGLQMVEALRKDEKGKQLPVIVLSVDEQTESINQALTAGVTVYLSKSNLAAGAIADQIAAALGAEQPEA